MPKDVRGRALELSAAIALEDGDATIEASYLAARLGLTVERLRAEMRRGIVYGVIERGEGADAGRKRLTVRYRDRVWSVIAAPDGHFEEPPQVKQPTEGAENEALSS